ncbi:MAG: glycosyltransferase family 4 protein [Acidobacteria bacterium]|nr:glycosyltransferase family 4 protein [Acidobacteriota bacterium]
MEVLTLIPNRRGFAPGQRGSIELWEPALREAGINLHWAPFETERLREILYQPGRRRAKAVEMARGYADRLKLLKRVGDYDAVFVYREAALLGPAFLERRIARRGVPIIYELDDPLYVPYRSPSNGYLSYLKFFGKIAEICRLAKVVIANSRHHVEFAARHIRAGKVWQVPSIVDTREYSFRPQPENLGRVTVGWSGSPTTTKNLRVVADALRELRGRVAHDVYLIGGTEFDLPGVEYEAQAWRRETEVEDLRRMQVGMVPVPVNEWNKRKFFMKTAQYMALGIPVVATPMGSNAYEIEHGRTGFLADTTGEWVKYLETLVRDEALRREMSGRAAEVARERFSLEANMPKVIEAFRAAAK